MKYKSTNQIPKPLKLVYMLGFYAKQAFNYIFVFFLYGLALIFTYHWKSANFSDVHFLQEFQCKPTKQTRRNYGKIPWHGTNSVWSIRKSNICRRFDEMLLDIPKSGFLSRFEILVCNPGLKRNNELINLAIGMTGSMQQFWFTVLENRKKWDIFFSDFKSLWRSFKILKYLSVRKMD